MRTTRFVGLMLALATAMSAQVGTVQDAAVYQEFALVGSIFLTPVLVSYPNLGVSPSPSANIVSPRMLAVLSYSLPAGFIFDPTTPTIATLSMRPVGSTTAIPVTVTNTAPGAITFVVPAAMPIGGAELLYQIAGQPTQWTTVNVVPASFELFRISSAGPAIAQTVGSNGAAGNVGLTTPIQPGQILHLTGSGLGNSSTVNAVIGGVAATVIYAGADSTQAGKDEILIQIPSGIQDGCYVPVTIGYNSSTVTTTISETSDGSPCRHPWQLSVSDMKTLDSGGALADGIVNLGTQINAVTSAAASRSESATMNLAQIAAGGIAGYFASAPIASGAACKAPPSGLSTAVFLRGDFPSPVSPVPDIGASVTLQNPTTAITLPGANGYYYATLPPPTDSPLSNLPQPVIAGGQWTWQSSGGKDLPASSFSFTLPAPIQVNGGAPISLRRDRDQTITWNDSPFDSTSTVSVFVNGIACTAPANLGAVTIPAALLSAFPANTIATLTINRSGPGAYFPHARFQLQNGSTLLMFVSYSTSDSRPVVFK